jgi:iron complex outermembrane receptor protein
MNVKRAFLSLVGVLSSLSWEAFAQSPAPVSPTAAEGGIGGLEEIVVTAQRRSERLQDVPIAVSAASAARLDAVNIQSSQDLALITPGLTIPQTSGYTQPHIRGVGTSANGPGIENPVATYIDGVYIASAPGSLLTLNNIDRIEVLKGPQGTLFGRNSTGGLIQVITKDPNETPSLAANVGYGNYQDVTTDLYATAGLGRNLAADVALRYEHQNGGFGHDLFDGREVGAIHHDFAGRMKFLFTPTDSTKIRLAVDYESRDSDRDIQHLDTNFATTFNNPFFGGPFPQGGTYDINYDTPFYNRLKAGGASLQINQDAGGVSLQSITAFRKSQFSFNIDLDLVPLNLVSAQSTAIDSQFSEELQVTSGNAERFRWVGGLFYFHDRAGWDPLSINFGPLTSPFPGTPGALVDDNHQVTNSIAPYAQATYEILPNTNLTLGGRYTHETKSVDGTVSLLDAGTPVATMPFPTPGFGIPTNLTFSRFNYRIALDYKITPDVLAYVSYNTGFKSGGFNLSDAVNAPYLPEGIKSVEGGVKSEFFDRRVRLNVAAFRYDYTNIQIQRYIANNIAIANGAGAKLYGLDLDGEWVITPNLSLIGGLSYLHARFTSFPNADFFNPIPGCTPPPGGTCTGSAAGNTLPYSPTTTFDIGGDYKIETAIGRVSANVTYFRSSEWFVAPANYARQDAYGLVNGSLSWTDASDHYLLKVWGKNLSNTNYATSLLESQPGVEMVKGYPRTYGITAGVRF